MVTVLLASGFQFVSEAFMARTFLVGDGGDASRRKPFARRDTLSRSIASMKEHQP